MATNAAMVGTSAHRGQDLCPSPGGRGPGSNQLGSAHPPGPGGGRLAGAVSGASMHAGVAGQELRDTPLDGRQRARRRGGVEVEVGPGDAIDARNRLAVTDESDWECVGQCAHRVILVHRRCSRADRSGHGGFTTE